jgi:hypothetical protein
MFYFLSSLREFTRSNPVTPFGLLRRCTSRNDVEN